jgi:hypothetical protein
MTKRERALEAELAAVRAELERVRTLECDRCLAKGQAISVDYSLEIVPPPVWRVLDLPTDEKGTEWLSGRLCPACVASFYAWIDERRADAERKPGA